jgi:lipopolysaccharide/colanic/teichoic acid biosynthesis glycosyltransferase
MVVKRIGDIIFSLSAIIILFPLFIVTAILVYVKLGSPIFFVQERPGRYGKIFKMVKFRTMNDKRDENGQLLPDKDRLTNFGRFLRSTSLDELPELINVLRGDMSLVGPRPLLVEYLNIYNERQKTRHNMLPGITGWAQVNGRNLISWNRKFELDVWYVENWSLLLDLKIVAITIKKVILRDGVNISKDISSEKFNGCN